MFKQQNSHRSTTRTKLPKATVYMKNNIAPNTKKNILQIKDRCQRTVKFKM